jgi:hypothetical protein
MINGVHALMDEENKLWDMIGVRAWFYK